jgi:hypothetical protein
MGQFPTRAAIEAWAARHEACWEIAPLVEMVKGEGVIQTGFELRIFAQTEHAPDERVATIFEAAYAIAAHVIPRSDLPLQFDVGAYDQSTHLRPETGFAAEIVVPIEVTFDDPHVKLSSAQVERVVAPIEAELRALGLKPKAWDAQR